MSSKQSIDPIELQRLHDLTMFERAARQQGYQQIAGIDEAGRGPLAGPVVAAACIIPEDIFLPGINDSKKLTPLKRQALFEQIKADSRIQFGIGVVSHSVIDAINIYQAAMEAMRIAVANLPVKPDYLLVDGLKLEYPTPSQKIIKGDQLSQSIAAASIIAKEIRDQIMLQYHQEWPHYGFDKHKGYGTAFHRNALGRHGPCPIHRLSFEWRKVECVSV